MQGNVDIGNQFLPAAMAPPKRINGQEQDRKANTQQNPRAGTALREQGRLGGGIGSIQDRDGGTRGEALAKRGGLLDPVEKYRFARCYAGGLVLPIFDRISVPNMHSKGSRTLLMVQPFRLGLNNRALRFFPLPNAEFLPGQFI